MKKPETALIVLCVVILAAISMLAYYGRIKMFENLCDAADRDDMNKARTLLAMDRTLANTKSKESGLTPLFFAKSRKMVELLLFYGADVNARGPGNLTPLHVLTCNLSNTDVIEILILRGADVNAKNNDGETALMWAAEVSHKDIVQYLISTGVDVNAKNNKGETALFYATRRCNDDVANLLRKHGAKE